jgi:hypothetical protein
MLQYGVTMPITVHNYRNIKYIPLDGVCVCRVAICPAYSATGLDAAAGKTRRQF